MPETTTNIDSGGAFIKLDLTSLTAFLAGVATTVVRQVMTVGDPNNAQAIAAVQNIPATGAEYAMMVRMVPGNSDLKAIFELLRLLVEQEQLIALALGAMPVESSSELDASPSDRPYVYTAPLSGSIWTAMGTERHLIINPTGAVAAFSLVLPPNALDGDTYDVMTSQVVTTFTASGSSGDVALGGPFTLQAYSMARWRYVSSIRTWFLGY
jgi:hypothetical protein